MKLRPLMILIGREGSVTDFSILFMGAGVLGSWKCLVSSGSVLGEKNQLVWPCPSLSSPAPIQTYFIHQSSCYCGSVEKIVSTTAIPLPAQAWAATPLPSQTRVCTRIHVPSLNNLFKSLQITFLSKSLLCSLCSEYSLSGSFGV